MSTATIDRLSLATRRIDDHLRFTGKAVSEPEYWDLILDQIENTIKAENAVEPTKVDISGMWIQPQVRFQSRLGFNVHWDEDSEWTEERTELAELISELPTIVKEQK